MLDRGKRGRSVFQNTFFGKREFFSDYLNTLFQIEGFDMFERKKRKKKERNQSQDFERENTKKNRKSRVGKSLLLFKHIICFKSIKRIEGFQKKERNQSQDFERENTRKNR